MGWSRLPQGDAMYLRADVKEVHDDGETKYLLSTKKRKSTLQLELKAHEEQLHAPADDSGFASDVSLSEDADRTNIDAIIEWVLPADGGFITPAASRSTTPMPTRPAKDEHWFNASFNADLVCPFPDEMSVGALNPQNSPMSEGQEQATSTPPFSSMDDF
ncbi:hypothetical protein AAVH_15112 [Aphelenchoides avenae]|nr:hypothetical protein AAVH_15112 [Aphelenchus avenae]